MDYRQSIHFIRRAFICWGEMRRLWMDFNWFAINRWALGELTLKYVSLFFCYLSWCHRPCSKISHRNDNDSSSMWYFWSFPFWVLDYHRLSSAHSCLYFLLQNLWTNNDCRFNLPSSVFCFFSFYCDLNQIPSNCCRYLSC